jgi:hypothetical protein
VSGASHESGEGQANVAETIADVKVRDRVAIFGEIRSSQTIRQGGSMACRVEFDDGSGSLSLLFLGRESIPGFEPGVRIQVWGTANADVSGLIVWNPRYEFVSATGLLSDKGTIKIGLVNREMVEL